MTDEKPTNDSCSTLNEIDLPINRQKILPSNII
jgi:hypothetical protein